MLDEPTTGLHFEDIRKLLGVLGRLVDAGNTVVVIEHNLDVIKTADWLIDLGPEGGSGGGLIVAEGTPEQVAGVAGSHTGSFLAPILQGSEVALEDPSLFDQDASTPTKKVPTKKAATKKAATKKATTKKATTRKTATKAAARKRA